MNRLELYRLKRKDKTTTAKARRRYNKNKTRSAILMGLNYPGTRFKLRGCVNDVRNCAKLLRKHKYSVKVLIDKDIKKNYNLLEALRELSQSQSKQIFFHYSGHGTRRRDTDGDEKDKWDEVVFSKDNVEITDDQISGVLSNTHGKTIFLIFDCCHSGTIVDLPYTLSPNGTTDKVTDKTFHSDIICISGCKDTQTSSDVTDKNVSYGALSHTLYKLMRKHYGKLTWLELWKLLVEEMRDAGYRQIPQLSASDPKLFNKKVEL